MAAVRPVCVEWADEVGVGAEIWTGEDVPVLAAARQRWSGCIWACGVWVVSAR